MLLQNYRVWSSEQKSLCRHLFSLWNDNLGLPFLLREGKSFLVFYKKVEGHEMQKTIP